MRYYHKIVDQFIIYCYVAKHYEVFAKLCSKNCFLKFCCKKRKHCGVEKNCCEKGNNFSQKKSWEIPDYP